MALGAIIGSAIAGLAGSALNTGVQSGINAAMTDWQMRYNAEQAQLNRDFQSQMLEGVQDFNSAEAQKQRDWETQMSNTAHQREIRRRNVFTGGRRL